MRLTCPLDGLRFIKNRAVPAAERLIEEQLYA